MGTASPAVILGEGGSRLTGEGGVPDYSGATDINSLPGTRFLMGVNNQTLFQGTSTKVRNLLGVKMSDFSIDTNAFTGGVGIDLTATQQLSSAGTLLESIYLNNIKADRATQNGSFSTGIILDGCADLTIRQITNGLTNTGSGTPSTTADVSFNSPSGDLQVDQCILYSGVAISGAWQVLQVRGGTYGPIKLVANATPNITRISDAYLGPTEANVNGDPFNVNGFAADMLELNGCWARPGSITNGGKTNYLVLLGGGTLDSLILRGCRIDKFSTNTTSITDSSANCGRRRAVATATRTNGALTSVLPYTLDVNNYLTEVA